MLERFVFVHIGLCLGILEETFKVTSLMPRVESDYIDACETLINVTKCPVKSKSEICTFSKIQLVVYYQCCVLIG